MQSAKVTILGSQFTVLSNNAVVQQIIARAKAKQPGYVCVSNVHTTMMGFFSNQYKNITNKATFTVPDGMPLVWAMRLLGAKKQDRVRGPSLMRSVCDEGRKFGLKHFLMGGTESTLMALSHELKTKYPGIQIVGQESPPFRLLKEQEWENIIAKVHATQTDILWIGLGAPKQENWMWNHKDKVRPIMLGVGAAFDLLAGKIPEAPLGLQKFGLEWLYRLWQEPKRLWKRYLFNNPAFLFLFLGQFIYAKIFRVSYVKSGGII